MVFGEVDDASPFLSGAEASELVGVRELSLLNHLQHRGNLPGQDQFLDLLLGRLRRLYRDDNRVCQEEVSWCTGLMKNKARGTELFLA